MFSLAEVEKNSAWTVLQYSLASSSDTNFSRSLFAATTKRKSSGRGGAGRNTVVVGVALADLNQPVIEVTEGIRIGDIVNQDGYALEIEPEDRHTCVAVLEVERADLLESFLS